MSYPTGPIVIRRRFFAQVHKTKTCWLWTGYKTRRGYGMLRAFQRQRWQAHRLSWFLHHGPIPKGKWVLHSCDNPACVNPDHLRLGDHLLNVADKVERKRQVKGEACPGHKLTEAKVRTILRLLQSQSYGRLAARFGVTKQAIAAIKKGKSWKHVLR